MEGTAKRCRTCGIEKTAEYFGVHKRYKSGYDTQCKECKKRDVAARYKAKKACPKEELQADILNNAHLRKMADALASVGGQYCPTCKTVKHFDDFRDDKKRQAGKAWQCRECAKVYFKEYYAENRQKIIARTLTYQADITAGKRRKRSPSWNKSLFEVIPTAPMPDATGHTYNEMLHSLLAVKEP